MRKYLSITVAVLILVLFAINYEALFDYESKVESTPTDNFYSEEVQFLEENDIVDLDLWGERPSLSELMTKSGNLSDINLKFDKPIAEEDEKVSEEDQRKLFFFGPPDDFTVGGGSDSNPNVTDGSEWDYWGDDFDLGSDFSQPSNPSQNNTPPSSSGSNEPIEVDLEEFIGKTQ